MTMKLGHRVNKNSTDLNSFVDNRGPVNILDLLDSDVDMPRAYMVVDSGYIPCRVVVDCTASNTLVEYWGSLHVRLEGYMAYLIAAIRTCRRRRRGASFHLVG